MTRTTKVALKWAFQFFILTFSCLFLTGYTPLQDIQKLILPDNSTDIPDIISTHKTKRINSSNSHPQIAYATTHESKDLISINLLSGSLEESFSIDFPAKIMGFSPDGTYLYLSNLETSHLLKMNLKTRSMDKITTPNGTPNRLTISPNGLKGYITFESQGDVVCLDFENENFSLLASFNQIPNCVVTSPHQEQLFVSFKDSCEIVAIDTESSHITPLSSLNSPPEDFVISLDGNKLYALEKGAKRLATININSKTSHTIDWDIPNALPIGSQSKGIIANIREGSLYVTYQHASEIVNFNLISLEIDSITHLSLPIDSIKFFPEPEIVASFTLTDPAASSSILFDASSTKGAKENELNYEWNFGDGVLTITQDPYIEHAYESTGLYSATLTVSREINDPSSQSYETPQKQIKKISTTRAEFIVFPQDNHPINPLAKLLTAGTLLDEALPADFDQLLGAGTPTSTTLGSSTNPSVFGQSVTFTATVSPIPTLGTTVTFKDGVTTIGTGNVNGSGIATLAVSNLSVSGSPHSITATYDGDAFFDPSTSNTVSQTVNQGSTTTTLNSVTPNPSTYGTTVNFTATVAAVSPATGTPTGTVNFLYGGVGGTLIGSGALNGSGVATLAINTLPPASYANITAVYAGSTNFSGSNSTGGPTLLVNLATPTNVLTSNLNPSNYGDLVTFTATVTSPTSLAFPTGTLTFYDGVTPLGTGTFTGSGNTRTATLSINSLSGSPPPHLITAVLDPDTFFNGVTSNTVTQNVNNSTPTTTKLISLSNSPTLYGQPVVLLAIISGSIANPPLPPSGNVEFWDDTTSTLLGTVTITTTLNANTVSATFTYTGPPYLALGSHLLRAEYLGDINYGASNSPQLTQNVVTANTTTTLTPNPTSEYGDPVTFVATVAAVSPAAGVPTGTVEFYDGIVSLGTASVDLSGQASLLVPTILSIGPHTITSIYLGDGNYTSSTSAPMTHTVIQDDTVTTLTSNINPSTFGQTITLTATVVPDQIPGGLPTGTVTFKDGATTIGTANLNGSGIATLQTCRLLPAFSGGTLTHSLTAVYGGDTNFITSTSNTVSQDVSNQLGTITTVTSDENPLAVSPITGGSGNDTVTLTATIVPASPCNPGPPQSGTVEFFDGVTSLGTANVINGVAQLPGIFFTTTGHHPITAVFSGDGPTPDYFTGSTSAPYDQVVVLYETTTTLTLSANPVQSNNAVFTATVVATGGPYVPGFGSTGGTMTFYQGNTAISSALPVPDSGIVTFPAPALCFNCNTVYAVYSGDDTYYDTSTSNSIEQQVQQTDMLTTQTAIAQNSATTYFCEPVTFTATVTEIISNCDPTPTGICTPSGTVTFFDGRTAIGTSTLNGGVATLTVSTLAIGSHTISSTYNSDSNFSFSSSPTITHTVIVNPTTTTLDLIPVLTSTPYGQLLNFIATVTSTSGTVPTGSVIFSDDNGTFATVEVNSNGRAIYSTAMMDAGTYNFTATYDPECCGSPQACFQASSISSPVTHTITQASPDLTLTAIPSPATYGQMIVLQANIASFGVGTPTGTVTFYKGATLLGTAPIVQGIATLAVGNYPAGFNIPAGVVTFNASYNGDTNFVVTQFPSLAETINKAPVAISLVTESPNASLFGQTVNLTASVQSVGLVTIPTGTVTFKDGGTTLGTVTLDTNGIASLNVSNFTVGTHATITATYNGDTNFLSPTTSQAVSQVVNKDDTLTTATTSGASTFGSSTSFTVTVAAATPGAGTPTGTVTGSFGNVSLGSQTLSGGTATFNTSALPAGTNTITFRYAGDGNFNPSTGFVTKTVNAISTTTTLNALPTPSVFGQPITFSTTVTSGSGTPTGIVTFFDGTTQLGVATLSSGAASITVNDLSVATHPIRVVYAGGGNFATSTSSTSNQVVNAANTTTTLATSLATSSYGEAVTFTANVIPTSPGAGTPTGTVTFTDGTWTSAAIPLGIGGIATVTPPATALAAGVHNITATFTPTAPLNFNTSTITTPALLTVSAAATVTNVYTPSSNNPSPIGGAVTLKVTVNSVDTGLVVPNGTVEAFYAGSSIGGPVNVNTAVNGVIDLPVTLPSLPTTGAFPIVVTYTPGTSPQNFLTSSGALDQIVRLTTSTTSVTSAPNPSTYGQNVTFTATVVGSGATGTVDFSENGVVIGTGVLSAGTATFSTTELSIGSHTITATYSGDASFSGSSGTQSPPQVVNKANSATTIVSISPNPSMFGDVVTFIATTTTPTGQPSGFVEYYDGLTLLGTVPTNGIAFFETNLLALGNHQITAKYLGDTNFNPSTSAPESLDVNQTAQTNTSVTTLDSDISPQDYGCPVTFTVVVSPNVPPLPPLPPTPTGVVTLFYGSQPLAVLTLVPTVPVDGTATVTFTTSDLPAGSLTIVALYSGDSIYSASSSTFIQVINPISTSLVLTTSGTPSVVKEPVTFTADVTAINVCSTPLIASGTVSFYDGATLLSTDPLDGNGSATFTTDLLTLGSHTINAVYNPDPNYTGSSDSLTQEVICNPTFTQMLTSLPNPSSEGETITFIASISSDGGTPTGNVTFYDNLVPILPNPVPLTNGLAVLKTSALLVGNHSITVSYAGTSNFCSSDSFATPYTQRVLVPVLDTNIFVSSSLNPAEFGNNVVLSATVTDLSGMGVPTGTVTFYDGSLNIGSSLLVNGVAQLPTSTLSIGNHPITAIYGGDTDYFGATSPVYIQVITGSSYPEAPHDFFGCQVINRYINFDDIVNILTWLPPQNNENIVRFEIYRDAALTDRIGIVKNQCPYRFEDTNRKKKKVYTYYIVSVNEQGRRSPAVSTKVLPLKKHKEN